MGYQYDANGQLEQESHINSCWQYDGTQNRTAYQALDGGDGQVYDFKNAIAYVLQDNYCQFVCQIMETEPCDLEDSLCSYDYIHGAQFNGTALINGQDANSFTWTEGVRSHLQYSRVLCRRWRAPSHLIVIADRYGRHIQDSESE
jgi:hypothetical protein